MTIKNWQVHFLLCPQAKPNAKLKFIIIVGEGHGSHIAIPINSRPGLRDQYSVIDPKYYGYLDRVSHPSFNEFWSFRSAELSNQTFRGYLRPEDRDELCRLMGAATTIRRKTRRILACDFNADEF